MLSCLVWTEYSHVNSLKNKYHLFYNTEDPHSTSFGFLGVWRNVYLAVFLHRCIQVRKDGGLAPGRGRGLMGSMSPERLLKYDEQSPSKLKCDDELYKFVSETKFPWEGRLPPDCLESLSLNLLFGSLGIIPSCRLGLFLSERSFAYHEGGPCSSAYLIDLDSISFWCRISKGQLRGHFAFKVPH